LVLCCIAFGLNNSFYITLKPLRSAYWSCVISPSAKYFFSQHP
jgi:hypothetical protein